METSQEKKTKNPLKSSKIYKIITWENKLHSSLAFLAVNVFFIFYAVRGLSLTNLTSKSMLIYIVYKVVRHITKKDHS